MCKGSNLITNGRTVKVGEMVCGPSDKEKTKGDELKVARRT